VQKSPEIRVINFSVCLGSITVIYQIA